MPLIRRIVHFACSLTRSVHICVQSNLRSNLDRQYVSFVGFCAFRGVLCSSRILSPGMHICAFVCIVYMCVDFDREAVLWVSFDVCGMCAGDS